MEPAKGILSSDYAPRIAEKALEDMLFSCGCLLVRGPKGSGKSTLARRFAASSFSIDTESAIQLALSDPASLLNGLKPRLIDEWQKAPDIWNHIKKDLDQDFSFGKYILTGSTSPADPKKILHSGAGRMATYDLGTFTLFETGESMGLLSLRQLSEGANPDAFLGPDENPMSLPQLAYIICRGGWPLSLKADPSRAILATRNYYKNLFSSKNTSDELALFLKGKNIASLRLVLTSLARNISTDARVSRMTADIRSSDPALRFDEETFASYRRALEELFIIRSTEAWTPSLRSAVRVLTSPVHRFCDTSIACAALSIGPKHLMGDLRSFGMFFEDFAFHELIEYASSFRATMHRYRDSSGLEIDGILVTEQDGYGAIEIKIASLENICRAKKSLLSFREKMKRNGVEPPRFLMVLTSHGYMHKDQDGIWVVPVNCLRP